MDNIIDARGLSCPQPVIMLQQVLGSKPDKCTLMATCPSALENTTRFAENAGYTVSYEQKGEEYHITFEKKSL